jgi:hypothetical protein
MSSTRPLHSIPIPAPRIVYVIPYEVLIPHPPVLLRRLMIITNLFRLITSSYYSN